MVDLQFHALQSGKAVQKVDLLTEAHTAGTYMSWDWSSDGGSYTLGERNDPTTARALGLMAAKLELASLGFNSPAMILTNGNFGVNSEKNVTAFQESVGMTASGKLGPDTMHELCRKRVANWQVGSTARIEIPDDLLGRVLMLESEVYPASRNTYSFPEFGQDDLDPEGDHAISQNHLPLTSKFSDGSYVAPKKIGTHTLTEMERWGYVYRIGRNVQYLAEGMRRNHKWLSQFAFNAGTSPEDLWRATVMAHNAPYWAKDWLIAGFPTSGGGIVHVANWVGDKFTWCWLYTDAVYARVW